MSRTITVRLSKELAAWLQHVATRVKGIADTGFLVAFASRNDRPHPPFVLAMLREGLVTLAFDCREHLPQLMSSIPGTASSAENETSAIAGPRRV